MEVHGRDGMLESAGRCLAAAFAQTDQRTMAALLRAAARYLDGYSERQAGKLGRSLSL